MSQIKLFEPDQKQRSVSSGAIQFLRDYVSNPLNFNIHRRINLKANNENFLISNYYNWNKPYWYSFSSNIAEAWHQAKVPGVYPNYLHDMYSTDEDFKRINGFRKSELITEKNAMISRHD